MLTKKFKFLVGSRFIFREGSTKGLGEITRIIPIHETDEQAQDENNVQNIDVKDITKLSSRKLNRLKSASLIQKSKSKRKTDYLANRNTNKKSNKHDSVLNK
jgi:hypothetical protein